VLVYVGDLAALVTAIERALVPSGRFAFSVEAIGGDGFCLTAGHRYAHSEAYIRHVIDQSGLVVEALKETTCRLEAGEPVRGYLAVTRRNGDEAPGRDGDPAAHVPVAALGL
jgi:predicted TPR repeat methyltransferase